MKEKTKTTKQKQSNIKAIILFILLILSVLATGYMVYSVFLLQGIENKIRYLFMTTLIVVLIGIVLGICRSFKKKKSKYLIATPFIAIYSSLLLVGGFYIMKAYQAVDAITTNNTVYSSSAVVLSDTKAEKIGDVKDKTIGMLDDKTNVVGYELPNEVIKKQKLSGEIKTYDSYIALLKALYNKDVDVAFLPTNYGIMFQNSNGDEFLEIEEETKIIYTATKEIKNKQINKETTLDKPFTILLMGVDSENESLAGSSFNGDSLMLITFNPTTLSTTILSIPRDSYVPIMCFSGHKKNKITHAAAYGEDCMIETIENFTGISIDYYVKINFKGVVNLVDTLGGVELDIPYAFCEQDSNRKFGNNTIYVEKGLQVLNGEQVLAFARNRHPWPQYCSKHYTNYSSDDFLRGQHQQEIVRALLNKLKEIGNINTIYSLLDTISNSMQTNMTTPQLLSLYNIAKDILVKSSGGEMEDLISIQRLYLSGSDAYIYDSGFDANLYNFILNDNSVKAISEAMKVNLGLKEPTIEKNMFFAIDEPYEEKVIGKNVKASNSVKLMPSFIGLSEAAATSKASQLGLKVTFKYVESTSGTNTVTAQSVAKGTDLSTVSSITLTINKKIAHTAKEPTKEDNKEPSKENTDSSKNDNSFKEEEKDNSNIDKNVNIDLEEE